MLGPYSSEDIYLTGGRLLVLPALLLPALVLLPALHVLLTLGLGAVRADTGGVVVTADDTGGPQPPGRVL